VAEDNATELADIGEEDRGLVQWMVKSMDTTTAETLVRLRTFRRRPPRTSTRSNSITGWKQTWMSSIQILKARLQFWVESGLNSMTLRKTRVDATLSNHYIPVCRNVNIQ